MRLFLCIPQLKHFSNMTKFISVNEGGQVQIAWTLGLKATNSKYQQFCTALWVLLANVWLPVTFMYLHSTD